jgi:tyrosyl-tRNA synthetase
MSFLAELEWRGLIQDVVNPEAILKLSPGTPFYVGMDPSAPSLQIGNLVPLIVSMHLGRAGLSPLLLFGGATGSIGDPSGKKAERQLLDKSSVDANVAKHQAKVLEIFDRAKVKTTFVNNYDWTAPLSVLDFLRDVGKFFTINYMLAKEFVKTRVEEDSISYTEFSYMLLQAFDFCHLYQHKNCKLQIGGSDQWGNITSGLELIRKKLSGEAYAFSFPLVTDSAGRKFGKSEGGAVWLDGSMTSPYRFHQFWLNVDDASVVKLLKIFTFLPQAEILRLETSVSQSPEKREAQIALADAVCDLVHGPEATAKAKRSAQVLFGGSLEGLSRADLEEIFAEVPSTSYDKQKLSGMSYLDLLAETKLVPSKGEGRRLITNGGAYLNNERVTDPQLRLPEALVESGMLVLRAGKKQYHLVKAHAA